MKSYPMPHKLAVIAGNMIDSEAFNLSSSLIHIFFGCNGPDKHCFTCCGINVSLEAALGNVIKTIPKFITNSESLFFSIEDGDFNKICYECAIK